MSVGIISFIKQELLEDIHIMQRSVKNHRNLTLKKVKPLEDEVEQLCRKKQHLKEELKLYQKSKRDWMKAILRKMSINDLKATHRSLNPDNPDYEDKKELVVTMVEMKEASIQEVTGDGGMNRGNSFSCNKPLPLPPTSMPQPHPPLPPQSWPRTTLAQPSTQLPPLPHLRLNEAMMRGPGTRHQGARAPHSTPQGTAVSIDLRSVIIFFFRICEGSVAKSSQHPSKTV